MDQTITVDGLRLAAHFSVPSGPVPVPSVLLCHGFPTGPRGAASSGSTFPELANRIARECGWLALAINCRGTGASEGDFSIDGWLSDLRGAVDTLHERDDVRGVWVVGVAEGGTLALCEAADDERVLGVATLAAPRNLADWTRDAARFLRYARRTGLIRDADFPPSPADWARESSNADAVRQAVRLAGRPVLVLHGSEDAVVPVDDARAIVEAVGPTAELQIVQAGGHELRHDPRAVAALLGWLDRQSI